MVTPSHPLSPRTGLPLIPKGRATRTCRCDDPAPEGLRAGIAQFNRGDYWECHETLEGLWRVEPDAVRYLYQGILLAGVGLYHLRRGNRHGALSKLRSSYEILAPYAPACMGVNVAQLRADVARILASVEDTAPDEPVSLAPAIVPTIIISRPIA